MAFRTYSIRVTPRAGADKVEDSVGPNGAPLLRVWVTAAPADGDANAAVVAVLAKHFGVAKRNVEIATGHAGRNKVVRVGFPD